ncbi:MAG: CHAT domain-containing protein [Haliscomenobacteraceae bacterium CHB4]|nr:hypothetical protein [Saprospiraceae bacterium]MCE7925956.1 CHAT domain-containing protein [Haliscomenobacteraceae bacterium CHB4]
MKKIFSFVVFAQFALCSFGQNMDSLAVVREVDSLIQVSRTLTEQREFEKALTVNESAEKLALEKLGRESAAYGNCCFNRGRVHDVKISFAEAEKGYLESMSIFEKAVGKEHSSYVNSLFNLAIVYDRMGQYAKAISLLTEVNSIREKTLGKEHPDYANGLNSLAILYIRTNQYEKAEAHFLESRNIREKTLGKEHPLYAASLNNLARLYTRIGQYEKAEPLYLESKAIREKTLGKEHSDYALSLYNLANLYRNMGQYEKAEPLLLESKAILEKKLGKEHPDYAGNLNSLAGFYKEMGQYERAEPLYLESKAIRQKVLGKDHPEYARSLINMADMYKDMGQYEKAEPLFLESKSILGKALGTKHSDYAWNIFNLAILYHEMGQYEKAEPLYLESMAIRETILGKEHPDYAWGLNSLAIFYRDIGNYEKAELLLLESKGILEKKLSKENPDYALSLNNLATFYRDRGQYEKAEPLYLESIRIREKILGKEHPDYTQSLNNLAGLYWSMGNYEKAEPLQLESVAIREKILGKEHPNYANSLSNLAGLYHELGQYEKAEHLFLESKAIREKILGKEHPSYSVSLNNLASLYYGMGRYEKAEPMFVELAQSDQAQVSKALHHLSGQELGIYLKLFSRKQDQILSFARQHTTNETEQICYNNSLFYKGFLLHAANRLKRLTGGDSATAEKYDLLRSCGRRLAAEYAKPIAERKGVEELETRINDLEKDLARTGSGYAEAVKQVNWQEVQRNLKPNEAAIEFVHYKYTKTKPTDSIFYVALLLRSGWSHPQLVGLFEEKSVQSLFNTVNTNAAAEQLYTARGDKKRDQSEKSEGIVVGIGESAGLYQLIWQPLDSLLQGVKTVYFSPSGLFHRLNLAAILIPGSGQVIGDRYKLVQLGSTRQLVSGSSSGRSTRTAVLFGGLRYNAQTATAPPDTATAGIASLRRSLGVRGSDNWNYLPGTEKEVLNISKTLTKSGYSVQSFAGHDGTESAFKSLGTNNTSSPAVLHLATHGFFFPDPKDTIRNPQSEIRNEASVFKISDNPLMRSGLILAGANRAWAGGKTPEGQEDGILTAYEISQMNLSNTELVVLSACETGLGDLAGNEGVYGLQRAFKIAGARYLIMSLWQVPDQETSEFMAIFYKNWLEEKREIPDAFRAAQKEMRERGFGPHQWAGFVLVE